MLVCFLVDGFSFSTSPEENLTHGFTANTTDKVFSHSYHGNDLGILQAAT